VQNIILHKFNFYDVTRSLSKQNNAETNTGSVQCISTNYSACPYK